MYMEDDEIALMFALLIIPAIIWLQLWVKKRRENRRNELGDEEFESTGRAFFSILIEGTAVIGGLIMIIVSSGVVIKYIIKFYT